MKPEGESFIHQADDFLEDAKYLFKGGRFKGCANRSYYTMFAAVQALLFEIGLFSKTHKGIQNLFNLHYIKTGLFEEKDSRSFQKAFDLRQKSDYDADSTISEQEAKELLDSASEFLEITKYYLINIK
jgi:uncharacterized protein (UPF0332 family)